MQPRHPASPTMEYLASAVEVCNYIFAAYRYIYTPEPQTLFELLMSALSLCISHVDHLQSVVLITAIVVAIGALPVLLR